LTAARAFFWQEKLQMKFAAWELTTSFPCSVFYYSFFNIHIYLPLFEHQSLFLCPVSEQVSQHLTYELARERKLACVVGDHLRLLDEFKIVRLIFEYQDNETK